MSRHNLIVASPSTLTLSEVDKWVDGEAQNLGPSSNPGSTAQAVPAASPDVPVAVPLHRHSPRLCAVCMPARFQAIKAAPHSRVSAEAIAERIRKDPNGGVWAAVVEFDVSYRHALAIRAGWRGGGRRADPIPYRGRGMDSGQRHGWWALRELKVVAPWDSKEPGWTINEHRLVTASSA